MSCQCRHPSQHADSCRHARRQNKLRECRGALDVLYNSLMIADSRGDEDRVSEIRREIDELEESK